MEVGVADSGLGLDVAVLYGPVIADVAEQSALGGYLVEQAVGGGTVQNAASLVIAR